MTNRPFFGSTAGILGGLGLALIAALPVSAQRSQRPVAPAGAPGEVVPAPERGFKLFGNADLAISGMRMAGNLAFGVSNLGPCSVTGPNLGPFLQNGCGALSYGGATNNSTFEIVLSAGIGPTDFRKIRAVHPGVNNHLGPQGFTQLSSHVRLGAGSQDWGPADNTLGRLFAGVTTTTDGSCRDHSSRANNFAQADVSLLAGSDCPQTWANGKFEGPRPIGDSAFIKLQQRQGNAFTFDYFKVPEADKDNSKFLGSFSTYGLISDHFTEAIQSYGSVTPKMSATAKPNRFGFPIGLDVHFEAFTFNRPNIADVVFYQMMVINRSADVYGTGINYDSLYMGLLHGFLVGGDQGPSIYALPHRNAVFAVRNGQNIGCNGAVFVAGNFQTTCQNQGFRNTHGFGIVMLKSPIGDTRNKLLTRPGAFNNPASPYADDTITFNHNHPCGFGNNCFSSTTGLNDRRGFGMISSTEANVLDGRDPGSLTAGQQWGTFRPKAHPVQPNAVFNRYVPGTWSYENKLRVPGQSLQDTIFFDNCHGAGFITIPTHNNGKPVPSCAVAFSDTMPGKQLNAGPGNIGGVMTAGPFPLKAGDTTSFVFAFLAARDSTGFEALVNAATDSYLGFFLGPDAPPLPKIAGARVESAEERDVIAEDPRVRLVFSDEPETFVDPFFVRFAQDLKTSQDPLFKRLRNINGPKFADTVEKISQNNFSELWIFKSCDGGTTFTNDADCAGDPTIGPSGTLGLGWQPYAIIRADANGNIPNSFTDNNVIGGRTYLYSLVTRSRGLVLPIRDVDPTDQSAACLADTTFTACKKIERLFTVADTATASIQTSGSSTIRVYVPISVPSGGIPTQFGVTNIVGGSTLPVNATLSGTAVSGDYRLIFGNRFIIQQRVTLATNQVMSTVRVQDIIPAAQTTTGGALNNHIEQETVLSGPGRLDFSGFTYTPTVLTGGGVRVETDTVDAPAGGSSNGLGFVLARGSAPLFISLSVIDTGTTPTTPTTFINRSDFPGFLVSLNQRAADTLQYERVIQDDGDTLNVGIMNANSLQFRQENSTRVNGRGMYTFTFKDDAFGPDVPFNVFGTAEQVGPKFRASIASRDVATTADTSARIRAIVGALGPRLAPITFPFTLTSARGNKIILAAPKRATAANTFLLGNGADTVRVEIDSLAWVPGDTFIVLEEMQVDSVIGGRVIVDAAGKRITQLDTVVAFNPAILGCNSPRTACNPAAFPGPGGTGYLPMKDGTKLVINYPVPFSLASEVSGRLLGPRVAGVTQSDLRKILVVPNPFVVQSQFNEIGGGRIGEPRLLFTGVPARGTLRIYTVSGQFLQQLTWTQGDLQNNSGDLPWNLRTREGTIVTSGLYIYVLTAHDERGKQVTARGKFVVIR